MAEILLVRHGETEWNRLGRFRGRADVPLNETGLRDVDATAQRIAREWTTAAIYSSPVPRAIQTAEVIAAATGLSARIVEDLADVDYGAWEGLTSAEAAKRHPRAMEIFLREPSRARIPGGETLREVPGRSFSALVALAAQHENETIVVVAHTDVNRLIILAALGANIDAIWRVGQGTCAINVLRVEKETIELVSVNDRCHLH